jgi:hypothetical protein
MDEEEKLNRALSAYIAQQQNEIDHLVRKVYGKDVRFEQLSPLGQHTIESLARERSAPPPITHHIRSERLSAEYEALKEKVAELLRENMDLWEENEQLRIELEDYEDSDSGRSGRR